MHKRKQLLTNITAALFILLFVYTAASKLADYETFTVQLGKSPMLTAFSDSVAWFIPAIEVVIAVLLAIPSFRLVGLYLSFALMVMFTSYIVAITSYSEFIPCSCGGVLQTMSWDEHLVFNIAFVLLAVIAILAHEPGKPEVSVSS